MKRNLPKVERIKKLKISSKFDEGTRLDHFLTANFPKYSRSRLQNLIRSGEVLVNSRHCKTGYKLELNDLITIMIPSELKEGYSTITPEPMNLNILFEDEDLAVIDKPSGLVVHPGKGNRSKTLANGILYHFSHLSNTNGLIRPGIVHRLDKDTSGLIIIAKNNNAHHQLSEQFKNRHVKKEYYALTWGLWKEKEGLINLRLQRDRRDPTRYCVSKIGKESITQYKVHKEFKHCSLIKFSPKTGRTHQIRVHAASIGHPIFGDEKYGGGLSKPKGYMVEYYRLYRDLMLKFNRYALHAKSLQFYHPKNKEIVKFKSSLPKKFMELINKLDSIVES